MDDGPQQRSLRRSALLNASLRRSGASPDVVDGLGAGGDSKLPLGVEPEAGSPDWAHRCRVPSVRIVPGKDRWLTLHALGLPRPRTPDGWPMPFAGKDPDDPCATERYLEIMCGRKRLCQVCGLGVGPDAAYVIRRPGHQYASLGEETVPWVEGRAPLHLGCLRFSARYCPELIRQFRQGVAHVVREPSGARYHVLDSVMLDTREYIGFIEPVWPYEAARDSGVTSDVVLRRLDDAAAVNARATATLFPRLALRRAE